MIYGSHERRKATEGLADKITATVAPIRDGAAQALHMSDPSTAEYLTTALRNDADFVGAVILGPDLFVRLRVGRNDAVEDELHLDTVRGWLGGGLKEVLGSQDRRLVSGSDALTEVVALRPPVARQRIVGYLVTHYSTARLERQIRDDLTGALTLGGLFLLMLNAVLALLLWRFTTPMVDLSRATQALAEGRLDLDVPHARRRDEIGAIARGIAVFQAPWSTACGCRRPPQPKSVARATARLESSGRSPTSASKRSGWWTASAARATRSKQRRVPSRTPSVLPATSRERRWARSRLRARRWKAWPRPPRTWRGR
jgi:HAMP domain-containing protein